MEEHTTPPTALLEELTAETQATMGSPEMLTGAVQGRLLELLVYAAAARRVLEIVDLHRLLRALDGGVTAPMGMMISAIVAR